MSLRTLVESYLNDRIERVYRTKNGLNKMVTLPNHATNVPCAWKDHDEVVDVGDGEVRTKAMVRILPEVDIRAKDVLVRNGQHYRVLVVDSSKPDFDGSYLFKILKVT